LPPPDALRLRCLGQPGPRSKHGGAKRSIARADCLLRVSSIKPRSRRSCWNWHDSSPPAATAKHFVRHTAHQPPAELGRGSPERGRPSFLRQKVRPNRLAPPVVLPPRRPHYRLTIGPHIATLRVGAEGAEKRADGGWLRKGEEGEPQQDGRPTIGRSPVHSNRSPSSSHPSPDQQSRLLDLHFGAGRAAYSR